MIKLQNSSSCGFQYYLKRSKGIGGASKKRKMGKAVTYLRRLLDRVGV